MQNLRLALGVLTLGLVFAASAADEKDIEKDKDTPPPPTPKERLDKDIEQLTSKGWQLVRWQESGGRELRGRTKADISFTREGNEFTGTAEDGGKYRVDVEGGRLRLLTLVEKKAEKAKTKAKAKEKGKAAPKEKKAPLTIAVSLGLLRARRDEKTGRVQYYWMNLPGPGGSVQVWRLVAPDEPKDK